MARAPRSKPIETKSSLLQALEFCSVVSEKLGSAYETHIGLRNHWAIAFNGIVAAGAPIMEDIYCHAHNLLLIEALSKCDENFSLTQLDNGRLSIKSGKFKAVVPCLDPALMQEALPDPLIAPITNKFKDAVAAVGVLANEDAQHVLMASVLMNGASVISTNRKVIYEYWHGNSMPTLSIPKAFVKILKNIKKNLSGFGFSNNSFTLWFEDNCWLKTQLYSDTWPDLSSILDLKCNDWNVPSDLWKAIDAIKNFSEDGWIFSKDGILYSHNDKNVGASFECSGVPNGISLFIEQLELVKPWAKTIDFNAPIPNGQCIKVFGNEARCIIAHRL